ncbi:MAG: YggS family pyridoxal phosphate-dependent enzyme [Pseudomonadales bacterium]
MSRLAENLTSVKARITNAAKDAGRDPHSIKLVAVSKTMPAEDVRLAIDAGHRDFGENYLQDALAKIEAVQQPDVVWHFIGPIQSNKTRNIAENFQWVQTLDREKIARRLNDQRPDSLPPLNICIQINLDDENSKSGVSIDRAIELGFLVQELSNLELRGLMFIPAPRDNADARRQTCQRAMQLFKLFQREFPKCDTLSLGMSADLEEAIAAGSTMVRIGTDIFGAREP